MLDNRDQIIELAQELDKICQKNNIWYSLDKHSLLGAVRHGGFVPWIIKFEVMVSLDGLAKLKSAASKNIVDSSLDLSFKSLKSIFVKDAKDWRRDQPFVEIRPLVPTDVKQYARFVSFRAWLKRHALLKVDNQKHAIDDLHVQKNEGYFLLGDRRRANLDESWIQVLSFKVAKLKINNVSFPAIVEYDDFLKRAFGENYLKLHSVPAKLFQYPAPLKKVAQLD